MADHRWRKPGAGRQLDGGPPAADEVSLDDSGDVHEAMDVRLSVTSQDEVVHDNASAPDTVSVQSKTTSRRLKALMEYLGLTAAALARELDASPGTVSNWLNENRGAKGASGDMKLRLLRTYGLRAEYWESTKDLSPKDCGARPKIAKMSPMGTELQQTNQDEWRLFYDQQATIARVVARHGDPPEILRGLMELIPREGTDMEWWLMKYFELRDLLSSDE